MRARRRTGFTLVEVLLVVVILAILAATVIPQFTESGENAKESATMQNLRTLRSQIEMYKLQHNGAVPSNANLSQLTGKTNADGTANASGAFGPYLIGGVPFNPYNNSNTVTTTTNNPPSAAVEGGAGWLYNTTTGGIWANTDEALTPVAK
ncbi:MAG: prepilin-type N-terminal cleavage/methylation domain-containing protein [Pirellulales bacterium]|nr:prepilin-type N-terminal cleavage/methylation domain-containing protein [Pirellulales bacterium]